MEKKHHKEKLLQELYKPYLQCTSCPLGSLGRNTVVFGEGNPDARLVFIGEGPGRDEDAQGRPFIGRSGKLLTRVLTELGIDRNEVFITNIVKCRPPNNRKPLPQETSICTKLLLFKQLEIIQPLVICSLGATALEGLLGPKATLSQNRGKEITMLNGASLVPTYHPAYLLRNPPALKFFIEDIFFAKQILSARIK